MNKKDIFESFKVGNYVEKFSKKYFKIEEIINESEKIKMRRLNGSNIETVQKHDIIGIELLPEHMLKMGFSEINYCKLIGDNNDYLVKIFMKTVFDRSNFTQRNILWAILPSKEGRYYSRGYLIIDSSIIENGLECKDIEHLEKEDKLISMGFVHLLQNYFNNELKICDFDFTYILQ
jgi:hypothetical protein